MNRIDTFIGTLDDALRTLAAPAAGARARPQVDVREGIPLTDSERSDVVAMMRVNHTGEVCAQALYTGQLLFARSESTRQVLATAALEERDHLAWCEARLDELKARPSLLNPVWYAGSLALGAVSGLAGDKTSLAFLAETEHQVESHLTGHLQRVPRHDVDTTVILEQMRDDERRHGQSGRDHGAPDLPWPIRAAMRGMSKIMTVIASRI
jgi:3-demethoxyubiquinol 3-hydroxylase